MVAAKLHKMFFIVIFLLFSVSSVFADNPVVFNPANPKAGESVTVTYNGFLKDDGPNVIMHWGYDSYKTGGIDMEMSKQSDSAWTVSVIIPGEATSTFDAVFHNGEGKWDNNSEADYHAALIFENPIIVNKLGAEYNPGSTTFAIWSPDSSNVVVNVDGIEHSCKRVPDFNGYTDIYAAIVKGNHKLKEYQFKINSIAVRDPYGIMVKPGTDVNIIMDMVSIEPEGGWVDPPPLIEREDTVVYEVHIRDLTIDSNSGVLPQNRGKFPGMVEAGATYKGLPTGIDHIKELGITHVQLMPFYDFATPHYNWGYDPINFNVPEDQYSLTPFDYENRVNELKTMINEFHKNGIRVIMDVVYNHTFADETFENITRKYYTGKNDSGTGNGINSAVPMVSRFIQDSLEFWVKEYKVDGFRFDLLGVFFYEDVKKWGEYLNEKFSDRNLVLYGEPWVGGNYGDRSDQRVRLGTVAQLASAHIGVFNDQYRNAVKGDSNECQSGGYMFNGPVDLFAIKVGSRGAIRFSKEKNPLPNLSDQMFAFDPEQTITYVSAHDNLCLWDKVKKCGEDNEYGKRVVRFATAMVLTSQGIPFIHAGDEMLRTKVVDGDWTFAHNSFNAHDEYNMIRWDWKVQNKEIFQYVKDLITIRKAHPGFRLNTWDEINDWMRTYTDGKAVVSQIDADKNGDTWDEILVVYNSGNEYHVTLPQGTWTKVFDINGSVNVPNLTGSAPCEGTAVTVFAKRTTVGDPDDNSVLRICFKKPDDWSEAYIYTWAVEGGTVTELRGSWPGRPMIESPDEGDNWYCDKFEGQQHINLIFNNNGSPQTSNLSREENGYYKDNKWTTTNPEGPKVPDVSASPAGGHFKDTVEVTLNVSSEGAPLLTSTYKLGSDSGVSFNNGDTVVIGADMELGQGKTLQLCAANKVGETCKDFVFTKVESVTQKFSWDNATVYFVLTDRFLDGNPDNNHSYGRELNQEGNPYSGYQDKIGTFNGGDLKGLTQKLNDGYFEALGINAIWLTSPLEQIHGWVGGLNFRHYAYHGYYILDLTEIDANMGNEADFREFVDTAHEKGIRVVMDVVMNHVGYPSLKDMHEFDFGESNPGWEDYYYNRPENDAHFDTYKNFINTSSTERWARWWGSDWIRSDHPGNDNCGGNDETRCLAGLPDIKTESGQDVDLPPILLRKWDDGKEAEELEELDAFFARTGKPRTPRNHLIKWLTDWVREYGIDGFRCDTAKHVSLDVWADLKEEAEVALNDWKTAHPSKVLDDAEFWMTGEVWGHGVFKDDYFTNGGFDSLINFGFQDAAGDLPRMAEIYRSYANAINNDPGFNMLSYISSHDTRLGGRNNLINAGTSLLLLPGGVQLFYGDETARESVDRPWDQHSRSRMNWGSFNRDVLSHWQKLSNFRNKHIAVGAGRHTEIPSTKGFAFSRVYDKNNNIDKVVCVIEASGSITVTVSSVFNDGATVKDYYTDVSATVTNGKVTFTPDSSGVLLIERVGG